MQEVSRDREIVLFIGTQFSNLYTAVQEVSRGNLIMGSGFQFDMVPIVDALNAVTSAPVHAKDATSALSGRADITEADSGFDGERGRGRRRPPPTVRAAQRLVRAAATAPLPTGRVRVADATSENISDGDGEGRSEGREGEGRSLGGSASEGHSGSDGESAGGVRVPKFGSFS